MWVTRWNVRRLRPLIPYYTCSSSSLPGLPASELLRPENITTTTWPARSTWTSRCRKEVSNTTVRMAYATLPWVLGHISSALSISLPLSPPRPSMSTSFSRRRHLPYFSPLFSPCSFDVLLMETAAASRKEERG